jgi:tetratricopeptide (TPR) repeat protein
MKIKHILFSLIACLLFIQCSDVLDVPIPGNNLLAEDAIESVDDLQALSNSNYDVFANAFNGLGQRLSELLADDVFIEANTGFLAQVYNRSSDFFNSDVGGFYGEPYFAIRRANAILDQLEIFDMTEEQRQKFEGEARFMRGICHFELVRLFAQPYGFSSDNSHLGIVISESNSFEFDIQARSTVAEVYDYVIEELKQAEELLPEENGVYATKWAAKAYLAKVYFQMNDYENAMNYARDVIDNSPHQFDPNINYRYDTLISSEAVFYTVSTGPIDNRAGTFTSPDMYFSANDVVPFIRVSDELGDMISSNENDLRNNWIEVREIGANEQYVYTKYNLQYMNVVHASISEMLLIAAESMAEQSTNVSLAIEYVNRIKERAALDPLPSSTGRLGVIQEARVERRKEFCGDGYRLHDLKRRGAKGENVIIRGAEWDCPGMVLQFPASEITVESFVLNPEGGCN